jgi:carbon monoxide dehydrogenase subunit G
VAIQIQKAFDVDRPPHDVWEFLVTPAQVVACIPGARLLRIIDERSFEGVIGVRLGPVGATLFGTVRFDVMDREHYRVAMSGRAVEQRGSGRIEMFMRSTLESRDGGGTTVLMTQSVRLSGRFAFFGRGGFIRNLADRVFGRFAGCVQEQLSVRD